MTVPDHASNSSLPLIAASATSSKIECAALCLTSFDCASFYFHDVTHDCETFRDTAPEMVLDDTNWKLYRRI